MRICCTVHVCVCVYDICTVICTYHDCTLFIYTFLTTYSAPFERFNGHLPGNCKCFGPLLLLLCDDLASAIKVMCITNLPLFMHTKIARQLTSRVCGCVCEGRSSGFACSDSVQKKNKKKAKEYCEKYLRVYKPQNIAKNAGPRDFSSESLGELVYINPKKNSHFKIFPLFVFAAVFPIYRVSVRALFSFQILSCFILTTSRSGRSFPIAKQIATAAAAAAPILVLHTYTYYWFSHICMCNGDLHSENKRLIEAKSNGDICIYIYIYRS